MKFNHTPGPWRFYNFHGEIHVSTESVSSKTICILEAHRSQTDAQHEADARLIAAAPELLAAIKKILDPSLNNETVRQEMAAASALVTRIQYGELPEPNNDRNEFHARGRCEDFPCCGHQLGECPTGEPRICPDCGRSFEPTSMNSKFCLACGSRPQKPKPPEILCEVEPGKCDECGAIGEREGVTYRGKTQNLCEACVEAVEEGWSSDCQDIDSGFHDYRDEDRY